jgi:hypothetical protein
VKFTIDIPDQVIDEESELKDYLDALQLMVNRMAMSHFKYGNMSDKFPDSANAAEGVKKRMAMYKESGNTENCLDAANYAVIEYLFSSHEKAHFRAQAAHESPGQPWKER